MFRFDPGAAHVKFMVGEVALRQAFLLVLLFSPVSSIPPRLHTHFIYMLLLPKGQQD